MNEKPRAASRRRYPWLMLLLPAALILQFVSSRNISATEEIYSRRIYPVLAAVFSLPARYIPFPAAELIAALLAAFFVFILLRGTVRLFRRGPRVLAGGLAKLAAFLCAAYFLFVVLWGLNYCRAPLAETLGLDASSPSETELYSALDSEISAVNSLCGSIDYTSSGASGYDGGFDGMRLQVNAGFDALESSLMQSDRYFAHVRSSPKSVFGSQYMAYTGISGIFVPFTYEPCICTDCPSFTLPFTISHETAHLKGYAREEEANMLAYLACCANPDVYYRYSGHLNAFIYLYDALYPTGGDTLRTHVAKLDRRAAKDVNIYFAYLRAHEGRAENTATKINDNYLKAQGQTGVASYDRFVVLLCAENKKSAG